MTKHQENVLPPAPELKYLGEYLDFLPPFIARKKVAYFTGGAVSPKKVINDEAMMRGPAVRQKIGGTVVYPTIFFLAYLEEQGVETIVVPKA